MFFLLKDKRIARQFGYSARGTPGVVKDFSDSRWAPHYSAIAAVSSEGLLANCVLKSADERFDAGSFIRLLDELLIPPGQ